jgi:NAD(P)-dependent dehydrogenase (short-subunit alcohol dehydrogenase family)
MRGKSAYVTSKLGMVRLFEFVADEYPDVQVLSIHPGVVDTAMNKKSQVNEFPMDDGELEKVPGVWF